MVVDGRIVIAPEEDDEGAENPEADLMNPASDPRHACTFILYCPISGSSCNEYFPGLQGLVMKLFVFYDFICYFICCPLC